MAEQTQMHIHKAGPLVLMQDFGRFNYKSYGLTRGGPADEHAFCWANKLLNNSIHSPAIEITMGSFEATFESQTVIAITGADLGFRIQGIKKNNWSTHLVQPGQRISFKAGAESKGTRAYLAVKGGFHAPYCFGSASTISTERNIPTNDHLKKGMMMSYYPVNHDSMTKRVHWQFIPNYNYHTQLNFIRTGQWEQFSISNQKLLLESKFKVSNEISRMGYRLKGPRMKYPPTGILSEGITRGMIQVPPDGNPIVLLNDHQTIGGYATLGCLTHDACNKLSQCRFGDTLSFHPIDLKKAQEQRRNFLKFFSKKPVLSQK